MDGGKDLDAHNACTDNACERPTSLPDNSVVVSEDCPEHGKLNEDTCGAVQLSEMPHKQPKDKSE